MTTDERIVRYLDKIPGAISGSDGHGQTFTVACALVNGFALDADTAMRYLRDHYNPRCSPPWKPRELRHKVVQAEKTAHSKPRGHLLGAAGDRRPEAVQSVAKPVPVTLTPRKERFRTLRTTIFNPYGHTREKELPHTHRSVGAFQPSEASEPAIIGNQEARSTSTGIPVDPPGSVQIHTDPPLDWTAINAQFPPTPLDEEWRAVEAAGFGDDPLIALAFDLFGPGCRVLSPEETTV